MRRINLKFVIWLKFNTDVTYKICGTENYYSKVLFSFRFNFD